VRVDEKEISPFSEDQLFALGPNVRPRVNAWESTDERDVLDAEHDGYKRLAQPVLHRRIITFDKRELFWMIEDRFTGEGAHQFEFFFNFDSGLDVTVTPDGRAVAQDERAAIQIAPATGNTFETKITSRWVSPSYGTRLRSSAIMYRLQASVPFKNVFFLVPYRIGDEEKIERLLEVGKKGGS
jgi:hypothetical protein